LNSLELREIVRRAGTCAVSAVAIAGVMPAPTQAAAGLSASVRVQGVIAATWSGDPARGCAGAGTCGLSGSLTFNPSRTGDLETGEEGFGFGGRLESGPPIVRAVREVPGSSPALCMDVLQDAFYGSAIVDAFRGDVTAGFSGLLLSAGRCAGPRLLDLARALPSRSVSLRTLARGPQTIDLSGRFPFAAGSFSGAVISTIKVHVGRARRPRRARPDRSVEERKRSVPSRRRGRRSLTRYGTLTLDYRIERLSGAIATDFSGLADPSCRMLDACGAQGTSTHSVEGHAGRVEVVTTRVLKRGQRPTVRSELRRLRRGRVFVEAGGKAIGASAHISERLALPGAPDCVDSLFTEPPSLDFGDARDGVSVFLGPSNLGRDADTIRTRCPGPTHEIVLGEDDDEHPLAQGTIPFAALGDKTVSVSMGSVLRFSGGGYAGARRGAVTLDMRLRRSRVAVERIPD
jgi:hypothetical protein